MTNDYAPPEELDVPPGMYQAMIRAVIEDAGETVVLFELTEPDPETDKNNPQAGLGGRMARMWLSLGHENPVTRREAEASLYGLLQATEMPEAEDLKDVLGAVVRVQVSRVVMQSDPSRYKAAVVYVLPLQPNPPRFVQ